MDTNRENETRTYVERALFVCDDEGESYREAMLDNPFGCRVEAVGIDAFLAEPERRLRGYGHLVAAVDAVFFDELLRLAHVHGFSMGFLPHPSMKKLRQLLQMPQDEAENIAVALGARPQPVNLVRINGTFVFGDFIVGSLPLTASAPGLKKRGFFGKVWTGIRQLFKTRLQRVSVETASGRKITTAMSGLFILQRRRNDPLARLSRVDFSLRDSRIVVVIVSPFSVYEFFKTALALLSPVRGESLPGSVGYLKSESVVIEPGVSRWGHRENGAKIRAPFRCEMVKEAVRINASERFWEENPKISEDRETVRIDNLPDEKEAERYHGRHVPLFSCASEDRFRELFLQLRGDAKIDGIYIVMMLLSTLLATLGLFADSAAVVIGAMLLAPLMAPIVSLAMGLLRADEQLFMPSLGKIAAGIALALGASAFVTWLLPDTTLTAQIHARTHPTLLDLGVAVLSGIAAAYSKSFKEIVQSLAGVSIAVALVPPLATAGIGLGVGNFPVFTEAFLLFFTNLVGIVLSATMTFYVLGYSNALRSRHGVAAVAALMLLVSFPLYRSYTDIVRRHDIARTLAQTHYRVNGKRLLIESSEVEFRGGRLKLDLLLATPDALERGDLERFKRRLRERFGPDIDLRVRIEYLL